MLKTVECPLRALCVPVRIKTWGQDDIMFKSTKIFHLFDKISGNSGRHFLQPSQPIDFQSILINDHYPKKQK